MTKAERVDLMVKAHLGLVSTIARSVKRLFPWGVELDDLEQCGRLGLMQAAQRYEPRRRTPFHVYAQARIKGAMLDHRRRKDYTFALHDSFPEGELDHSGFQENQRPALALVDRRTPSPEQQLVKKELNVVLRRALLKLPYIHQQVATMRANGASYKEIGASEGRGATWAFYRYQEALAKMRGDHELKRAA